MAITPKDITLLKEVFATKEDLKEFATKKDLRKVRDDFSQRMDDQFHNFADLLRQEIKASENRQVTALQTTKTEIISQITEFIGNHLVPQLDSHEQRITKLETTHS